MMNDAPNPRNSFSDRRSRRGLTMVESLVAMSIATVAGTAMLTSISTAISSSTEAADSAVAAGLVEQLVDEISATRFPAATNVTLAQPKVRSTFDDIDDFANWIATPPTDPSGQPIGTEAAPSVGTGQRTSLMQADASFLLNLTQEIVVERVQPSGTGGWTVVTQHTNYRRVTVRIKKSAPNTAEKTLAEIVRIFTYVPSST